MKQAVAVFLTSLFALSAPIVVSAQSVCTPQGKELISGLNAQGQNLIGWGIGADGSLVRVFGKEGNEFTILYQLPKEGMVCFGGAGTDWHSADKPKPAGKDS